MALSIAAAAVVALSVSCRGAKRVAAEDAQQEVAPAVDDRMLITLSDSLIQARGADTIDFGRVCEGDVVTREIRVRNGGDTPMVITRLDLTCGCIQADYPRQPLRPGEEADMTVSFDSSRLGGWIYKTALVYTSITQTAYIIVIIAEIE